MIELRLSRSKSILRTGGAAQGEKRTNGVHYPQDLQKLQILPRSGSNAPRYTGEIGSSIGFWRGGGGGSGDVADGGASGNYESVGSGRVRSLPTEAATIDVGNLSDDLTPLSQKIQDRIDFSVVFGELQAKYNQNEDYEDEGPGDPIPDGKQEGDEETQKPRAPHQRIAIFAFRLALIEKIASGLGKIAFVWATVVILGGFASIVRLTDFLVVTVIILAEATRIFGRSHELEWQHVSSKSSGLGLHSLVDAARSIRRQRSTEESRHAAKTNPTARRVTALRALSAPGRLLGTPPKSTSPHSPESDLRTPTNSSSASSRHNRRQVGATLLPTSSLPAIPPPTIASELPGTKWPPNVAILPFAGGAFTTELVGRVLVYAQIVSAGVSIGFAFWRLSSQCFVYNNSEGDSGGSGSAPSPADSGGNSQCSSQANVTVSMNLFYVLAVLEAGLFLVEKVYWEYRIRLKKLLDQVCKEDHVGDENVELVKQFFYDVYAESLKGSVFDGLDMDLVKYSIAWLQTDEFDQQLGGARLLNRFVSKNNKFRSNDRFAADALRTLGTTPGIIERLVEMLSWGSKDEEQLLFQVSTIICRLVVYNRNCARFMAVPGAMDGVVSLLIPHISKSDDSQADKSSRKNSTQPLALRLTGLRILKCLCKDPKNSRKVGDQRGLLSIVMVFIEVRGGKSSFDSNREINDAHLKTYKKSLQVVLLLAAATNTSGGILRKRIAAVVSGLKNLRDIIEFGKRRPELQRLSVEILYNLAMEDDVRKTIGATGGVIRNLFKLFRKYKKVQDCSIDGAESPEDNRMREERKLACVKAGQTLARVVLQNEKNCMRLLELKDKRNEKKMVRVMVESLSHPEKKIACSAAQILRSVLKYADRSTKTEIATKTAPFLVKYIFSSNGASTKSELYEASLGLASRTLHSFDKETYWKILETVNKVEFVQQLMRNLKHTPTTTRYPRIRRYTVELIIALIAKDNSFLDAFEQTHSALTVVLEKTLDSTSEVENFCLFSGLVGYTRHLEEMDHLLERAIVALNIYHSGVHARDHACYLT